MQIHISRDGQSYGPYTPEQINQMLQNGEVVSSDSVWVQSTEWEKLSDLSGIFGSRSEAPNGNAVPSARSATESRLPTSSLTGSGMGLVSPQTSSNRNHYGVGPEYDGKENLMKGAIGL